MNAAPQTYNLVVSAKLLEFLHPRIRHLADSYAEKGEANMPGGSIYAKLRNIPPTRNTRLVVTRAELAQLQHPLETYAAADYKGVITHGQRRSCAGALRNIKTLLSI